MGDHLEPFTEVFHYLSHVTGQVLSYQPGHACFVALSLVQWLYHLIVRPRIFMLNLVLNIASITCQLEPANSWLEPLGRLFNLLNLHLCMRVCVCVCV